VGYAQFINKNHFAFLVEMATGLLIGIAILGWRRERFLLYLAGVVLLWTALVLSKSRGGLLALTVQLILTVLLFLRSRQTTTTREGRKTLPRWTRSLAMTAAMIGVLISVTVAGVGWLGGDQLATGVETASVEISNDAAVTREGARRRDIWRATWLMFRAHPLVGTGLGGYWAAIPTYHGASGLQTPQQAHNDYLELLAGGGLIGAAILIWFALVLLRQARQSLMVARGFQRTALLGALIGLAGVAIHSTVDFGLHVTINALIAVALLSILSLNQIWLRPKSELATDTGTLQNRER